METNQTIADCGATMPTSAELASAEYVPCPKRNQIHPGEFARCEAVSRRLGGPHGVSFDVCRMCQINGGADIATNKFLQGLACHLAFDGVVAGPTAIEPKQPSKAELETALGVVIEYRDRTVAGGFVEALVHHESITPEKAAQLVAEHGLAGT